MPTTPDDRLRHAIFDNNPQAVVDALEAGANPGLKIIHTKATRFLNMHFSKAFQQALQEHIDDGTGRCPHVQFYVHEAMAHAALRCQPGLYALIHQAHRHHFPLSESLAQTVVQNVAAMPESEPVLEQLRALVPPSFPLAEHVARGACNTSTPHDEKSTRAARQWALREGATFLVSLSAPNGVAELEHDGEVIPARAAVEKLFHFPIRAPGGLAEWVQARGADTSTPILQHLLVRAVQNASHDAFTLLWDLWQQREPTPFTVQRPLLHLAVAAQLSIGNTRAPFKFFKTVLAALPDPHAVDSKGNTALHEAVALFPKIKSSPITHARLFERIVGALEQQGLSPLTPNLKGETSLDLAQKTPQTASLAARWIEKEFQQTLSRVPEAKTRRRL